MHATVLRTRIGEPKRANYGPTAIEKLEIYSPKQSNAPINIQFTAARGASGRRRTMRFPPRC
jgi:hypothetical protein